MNTTSRLASILSAAWFAGTMLPGSLAAEQAGSSPVKIFILAGQSNMVGLGQIAGETTPGTVRYLIANEPEYAFLGDGAGGFRVYDDVWIRERTNAGGQLTVGYGGGSFGSSIGPEMGFGEVVSGLYEEQILIIKTAWGNRDLDYDFRPPSSGPFTGQMRANDPGFAYREMLDIINDVTDNLATYFPDYDGGGFEFAGFAWHQGWNDRIDATRSAAYETNMANFIRDVRTDLDAPGLPFVIATSAMDFNFQYTEVELAQLAMADADEYPEFAGNVAVVDARQPYKGLQFWQLTNESPSNDSIHWNRNAKSYANLGLAMGDAISTMIPARGPYRLEANSDATGVTLTWSEGVETPTALQVLRNGTEIAASAPIDPPVFFDAGAEPGLIEYTLSFSMPGEPTPDLSLTFDAGITALEAYRFRNSVKLGWENNLDYTAIEVRRDGVLIEPALDGAATNYVDEDPPASGTVIYSVVPANGSASPTEASINLDGQTPGNAYIYEPFDSDPTFREHAAGAGLQGYWFGSLNVVSDSMGFGGLPTSGNQTRGSSSAGAFIRPELSEAGLLDDGAELWFSFMTNNTAHTNTAVYFHLGTARSEFFGGMNDGGEAIGVNIASGSSPQAATWAPGRSASSTTGSIPSDTTALIVGKITWGADASSPDTVEIYLPGPDLALPASPVSTRSAVLDQSKFNVLCFGGKYAGSPKIDEIRFAANYADVVATDQFVEDTTPPSPDPMTWEMVPTARTDNSITMTATTATDANLVEYYFENVSGGGNDSGWQDSPIYVDMGLAFETEYSYRVQARDKSPAQNTTGWSPTASATTEPENPSLGLVVFFDDFESPVIANPTGYTIANTSQQIDTTKWVRATEGFAANRNGIVHEDENGGNTFTDPTGSQAWSGRYRVNTGLTSAFGQIGSLTAGQTITVQFDAVIDGWLDDPATSGSHGNTINGKDIAAYLVLFDGESTRNAVNPNFSSFINNTSAVLAQLVDTTSVTTSYQTFSFSYTVGDEVIDNNGAAAGVSTAWDQALLGHDIAIRFGAANRCIIDNVSISIISEPVGPGDNDYDTWAADFAPADLSDPDADFDGDGMTNREERLWGLDPTDGSSVNPITSGLDASTGTLSYTRRDTALTGATYTYQWSTTLAPDSWTPFTPALETADDGSPVETVTITLDGDLLTNPKLFVQVVASDE